MASRSLIAADRRPPRRSWPVLCASLTVCLAVLLLLASCGGADTNNTVTPSADSSGSITLYSGRSEALIAPLLEQFETATGINVNVRYGNSADLALLINAENRSPADVFISQSPGAIGFLNERGRLRQLPDSIINALPDGAAPASKTWVGLTGRQRVLVYNSELVDASELPASVFDLTDPTYRGRVGVAPQNSSFQDFITAMRTELGDAAAEEWLAAMAANDSPNYAKNSAIVDAVIRGEVELGLVNHYYLLRVLAEDPQAAAVNHYFAPDDIGSLVIVTSAGILDSSDNVPAAEALLSFLLAADAQQYFLQETREYPLSNAAPPLPAELPQLPQLSTAALNWEALSGGLERTIDLIQSSGIEQ